MGILDQRIAGFQCLVILPIGEQAAAEMNVGQMQDFEVLHLLLSYCLVFTIIS